MTPMFTSVTMAAIASQSPLIVLSAAAMSSGCTCRKVCHVSASTAPMTRSGRNLDAWPISQTTAVLKPARSLGMLGNGVADELMHRVGDRGVVAVEMMRAGQPHDADAGDAGHRRAGSLLLVRACD